MPNPFDPAVAPTDDERAEIAAELAGAVRLNRRGNLPPVENSAAGRAR